MSYLRQLPTRLRGRSGSWMAPDGEPPLRLELFSAEQMAQHGQALAASHRLAAEHLPDQLLARLAANESVLVDVSKLLTEAVVKNYRISPAGEWLLDNFYLIEEQIRTARRHLPKGYSRELPRLQMGTAIGTIGTIGTSGTAGRPRVYDIALEAVAHGDGRVDAESLARFVAAYQTVTALTLGELWAIPIMLRLAVIENLRRVGVRVAAGWVERNLATSWADQMTETAEKDPKSLILVISDMARSNPPLVSAFVTELARRLQGRGPALALPLTWIEQRLSELGLSIAQLVQLENQLQAANQVSISNSIGSLRVLGAVDWRTFVETMSIVEQTLLDDPNGVYGHMDFATRDRYRHAAERIAKHGRWTEVEVARQALALARAAASTAGRALDSDGRQSSERERVSHVGYYLVDKGVAELERAAQIRVSLLESLRRAASRSPLRLYLGAIALLTALMSGGLLLQPLALGLPTWALLPLGFLSLLVTSQLAVGWVNWLATLLVTPKPLARMDFSSGIPVQSRTLVVVPTLLSSRAGVEDLAEALEVRFLANRDPHLHFALLTDFCDAAQESMPTDGPLVELAQTRIVELNLKYRAANGRSLGDIFFLFHRVRTWNPEEGVWMGYERKRGKLAALNAALRGTLQEDFACLAGELSALSAVKYVITLDTDTQLPRDAARQFVGAMAHPLNHPVYDAARRRVTAGYGILQPGVAVNLPGTSRSCYARLQGGEPGIDPYSRAVSNVYQDVFGEGSFIGKGIYDVDTFEHALGGRFPENRILSHDLLEGCYARAGLLSDVPLYEDTPARYSADVSRRHRWMRGDWQLAGWLWRRVPSMKRTQQSGMSLALSPSTTSLETNPLSVLSQWKLIDNLRRSLIPVGLTLLLLLGWTVLSAAGWWTGAVLAILLLPSLTASLVDLLRKPNEVLLRQHLASIGHGVSRLLQQRAFELACLPYEAFVSLDAIARTTWRLRVSHTRLLEWNPSSEVERALSADRRSNLAASLRTMWVAPAIAVALTIYLLTETPVVLGVLAVAGPILLLWFVSPAIAWWISRPLTTRPASLSDEQTFFLRALTRRTWAFFERFVGPEDHWLPPDNVQEYRVTAIAHRTSPTNMGLALLANLTAYDFGYINARYLVERTAHTLRTMNDLPRHRGHFYNWYDTQTLQPLPPLYVSTVDSGNLAGHLLTLRAGLLALADERIVSPRLFDGLSDTLRIIAEEGGAVKSAEWAAESLAKSLAESLAESLANSRQELASASLTAADNLVALRLTLVRLTTAAARWVMPDTLPDGHRMLKNAPESSAESAWADAGWVPALIRQSQDALDDLHFLAPWLLLPVAPNGLETELAKLPQLSAIPTLRELANLGDDLGGKVNNRLNSENRNELDNEVNNTLLLNIARRLTAAATPEQRTWLTELQRAIALGSARARERMLGIEALAQQSFALAGMEYDFLFDKARHLLSIGYNVTERRADTSYYDLLASEARLSAFVAIAQGQVPQESWFALGRLLTGTGGEPVLLSWSGSMFEYLMPLLVMPTYDNTLLDQTCKAAVARQIEYGKQRGVPWGISESGYNTVDVHLNYQYRAFGVPGLGLKRGLAEDLVIAPYASALALMVAPEAACLNLQRLAADGYLGKFGFFEAIDYTPARQRRGQTSVAVRSFMAHHQGMSLLALAYQLLDRPMQRRFAADRRFQAVLLLLQERIPKATALFSHTAQLSDVRSTSLAAETPIRVFTTVDTPIPEVQLLSNGRYHVMVSNAGGGYSRWKDLAVTRWREDGTRDNWGSFCYIRELTPNVQSAAEEGEGDNEANIRFWSTTYQPTLTRPQSYEAIFSEGRAEFRRRDAVANGDGEFETYTEIVVSPEDDIELRRVRIANRSRRYREIEVTSYAEVVIAPAAADALHPAFSNLFVQTEILRERHAILSTRRPRSLSESAPWMLHLMAVHGAHVVEVSYETDRLHFIGRSRNTAIPLAMSEAAPLSGSEGSVLDPIVAIRYRIALAPQQSVVIDIVSGITETRAMAVCLIDKYQDRHLADRVFDLTWTHSQVVLRQLNATEADAQLYARLASYVIYANAGLRADAAVLIKNRRGQSGLWGYAISGDLPIVLLQIGDAANIDLVRQLVQAHAYWRLKGLSVDLVIWNEDHAGYRQQLQDRIMGLIASGIEASVIDRPGGIFVRLAEQMSSEDRILLQAVARAVITDVRGTLEEQLDRRSLIEARMPLLTTSRRFRPDAHFFTQAHTTASPKRDLILGNGLGGFTPDGREYVITLAPGQVTPAPWVNVLANPHFGTVVSESGVAYTWSENAHEFRLTPWHNDPVSDASGEALYLRDEETGHFWSPTPLPVCPSSRAFTSLANRSYVIRHGFGYSVFETRSAGICSELWVYVAVDAAVKFSVLKVRNESRRPRKLSATGYVEWVLGDLAAKSALHVSSEIDPHSGALTARNPYNAEFADRVAFFDADLSARHENNVSGDRNEFIGRNGSLRNPAALHRARLSGRVGAGLDPCGAIQVNFELAAGQEREIVFRLGVGRNAAEVSHLVHRFRGHLATRGALEAVWQHWNHTLGAVQVETPDPALNVLANGWLVYQTLACRIWARSGYYQSGGAFGFRDQLQDAMALLHARPGLVREHLLLCASRQFLEGDVQHWWHPPTGRGVRTHCSDDYLWLPLAVCRYVIGTGDSGVLDESVPFLDGRPVNPEDDSYYDLPGRSAETGSLYEHCVRAIRHGLRFGTHGLPLIGSGDWNDGMNLVGIGGQGESVWLGFFLCAVLRQFAQVAVIHNDPGFAELCVLEGARLRQNIEEHGWDGKWYRRAYFDDGTPLGSSSNSECRIDSISQSWSVLAGAGASVDANEVGGSLARSRMAMHAVDEQLVRRADGLIQLLDPPFDKTRLDPGYIRGYVPGVRENGGQYTHGAIWAAMAFAELGNSERAWELLNMINPVNHSLSATGIATYKVEPYVVAADVYALAPHTGRGGWSWYTGSAGWMYRLIVESLLGLRLAGETLHIEPCLPADWPGCKIHYRYRETVYHIAVGQTRSDRGMEDKSGERGQKFAEKSRVTNVRLDGIEQHNKAIPLLDDRQEHFVEVQVQTT